MRQFSDPIKLVGTNGDRFVISPMTEADIVPLASIYRKAWIRRDMARRVLDAGSPMSFEKAGGMFLIQDAESLAHLLDDPSEFVWVARAGNQPLGALWCGLNDEKYQNPSCILPQNGFETLPGYIESGLSNGTLYFSKEIIITPDQRGRGLPEALIDISMRFFYARGYQQSCGEVYYVHTMCDDKGEHAVGLFNGASFRMLLRTGCRLEGEFPPCVIHADGFEALISMRIVRWDLEPSLEAAKEMLLAAGMSMEKYV